MDKIVITGGRKLKGEALVSGAKNAALPIIAAALLGEEASRIENVPDLREKMFLLMFDANLSHQYGVAAKIRTGEFSIERHMEVLEELLKNAKKGE